MPSYMYMYNVYGNDGRREAQTQMSVFGLRGRGPAARRTPMIIDRKSLQSQNLSISQISQNLYVSKCYTCTGLHAAESAQQLVKLVHRPHPFTGRRHRTQT